MDYIKNNGFVSQAIFCNGVAILLLISLLLNYGKKNKNTKIEYKIFNWMLIFNAIQCFVELTTVLIDGEIFAGAQAIALVLNTVLFVCNLVFVIFWVFFAYFRHNIFVTRPPLKFFLLFIPAVLHLGLIFVNLFTPVLFTITDGNEYQRGGFFYYYSFISTYFYLIVGALISYSPSHNKNKYVFIPALTFLFPVFIASILQFFIPGISLIWVGTAIGLVSVYLSLMDESIAIDALSEVFSRGYLNDYLDKLSKRTDAENRFVGIMMDIDKFKVANDNYGHLVGDKIITSFGAVLKESIGKKGVAFRYAGDEFVVIAQFNEVGEIVEIIENIRKGVAESLSSKYFPEDITFSVGYAIYRKSESADSFLNRMDAQMYVNKNKKKAQLLAAQKKDVDYLALAGINREELLTRLLNNEDTLKTVLKKFVEETSYQKLLTAFENKDYKSAIDYAKTLRSVCGNLSLNDLHSRFKLLIENLSSGKEEAAVQQLGSIAIDYTNAVFHVENELKK